ncbi:hypothetical protein Tco_1124902 [Tanacetum coccineum]|uniref:Retrovirus-related Pol polyprotein from transposon TNT 1-94 n=1 Tax=Tanacetum coccineum TaxID=301880 RepID=A0ABQ5J7F6_9ASTR
MLLMQAQQNRVPLDEEQLLFIAGGQDNAIDEDVDEQPVQNLAHNVDNVFQADDCDAFDFDVDEAPTIQTMFMANLSSADPIYDEAGPFYDSDILSELKNQNLKESFGNNPSPPARDTPDFDSVFVIGKMKASIQGKDNAIKKLRTAESFIGKRNPYKQIVLLISGP